MKNLLVFLDQSTQSPARLEFALGLSDRLEAALTAVAVTLEPAYYFAGGEIGAQEMWVQELERARQAARDLAATADARLTRDGGQRALRSACLPVGAAAETAAKHARYADLSIIGNPAPGDAAAAAREVFDGALFDSGRPVLIAPDGADADAALARVMIAWDGGKQAARAVGDALPLMAKAQAVAVAVVAPDVSDDAHGEEPGGDIALNLARHGLNVDVHQLPRSGRSVAEALSTHARDWNAGMMVMGGYGHSRLRESLLGGVTHELISTSATPLLMSR